MTVLIGCIVMIAVAVVLHSWNEEDKKEGKDSGRGRDNGRDRGQRIPIIEKHRKKKEMAALRSEL